MHKQFCEKCRTYVYVSLQIEVIKKHENQEGFINSRLTLQNCNAVVQISTTIQGAAFTNQAKVGMMACHSITLLYVRVLTLSPLPLPECCILLKMMMDMMSTSISTSINILLYS